MLTNTVIFRNHCHMRLFSFQMTVRSVCLDSDLQSLQFLITLLHNLTTSLKINWRLKKNALQYHNASQPM